MPDVVVAGTICVDLIPRFSSAPTVDPGKLFHVGPLELRAGGCVANTGRALASLGADVALAADAGDDALGELLVASLVGSGLDCSAIRLLPNARTSYSVVVEASGFDRMFWHHGGANDLFDGSTIDLGATRLLHLGYPSVLPTLSAGDGDRLLALLTRANAAGVTTSIDLATVDRSWDEVDWPRLFERMLPLTDVLVPSVDDIATALGLADPRIDELAEQLLAAGAGVVLLKHGRRGLHLLAGTRERLARGGAVLSPLADAWADADVRLPALAVDERGTTGAGDAAAAGLLFALLRHAGPEQGARLTAAAGAAMVESGGTLPQVELLERRLAEGWDSRDADAPAGAEGAATTTGRS